STHFPEPPVARMLVGRCAGELVATLNEEYTMSGIASLRQLVSALGKRIRSSSRSPLPRRPGSKTSRLCLEELETRRLLSLVPVTVAIPELVQTRNPDSSFFAGDGDYYAVVRIGNHPERNSINRIFEGEHIFPNWHFTDYVESSGGPITIQIR